MTEKINELETFVLLEQKNIEEENTKNAIKKAKKKKTHTHKKEIFATQRSVIKNALKLHDQRDVVINAFVNQDILSRDVEEGVYYKPEELEPEFEESLAERTKLRR